jgi:hypothetical protein
MTDFASLFTDPQASGFQADPGEAAAWQGNPTGILHALAARRMNNDRMDAYAEALAQHDQRAREGASALMKQEFGNNALLHMVDKDRMDPSLMLDLAGVPRQADGTVDPRGRAASIAYQGQQRAQIYKLLGEAANQAGQGGKVFLGMPQFARSFELGNVGNTLTPGERQENAKADANLNKTVATWAPVIGNDGSADGSATFRAEFRGPGQAQQARTWVDQQRGAKGGGKDKPPPPPPPPPPGTVPTNAAGGKGGPELRGPQDAEPPAQVEPVRITSNAQLNALPNPIKLQLNRLIQGKNNMLRPIPNSMAIGPDGNVYLLVNSAEGGRYVQRRAMIDQRGTVHVEG